MGKADEKNGNDLIITHIVPTVEHVIFVRDYGQTYIAREGVKRASCTAGREHAARKLAEKLMGGRKFNLGRAYPLNDRIYLVYV